MVLDFFCIDLTAKENVERGSSLLFVLSISSTARDLAARALANSGLSSLSALGFLGKCFRNNQPSCYPVYIIVLVKFEEKTAADHGDAGESHGG